MRANTTTKSGMLALEQTLRRTQQALIVAEDALRYERARRQEDLTKLQKDLARTKKRLAETRSRNTGLRSNNLVLSMRLDQVQEIHQLHDGHCVAGCPKWPCRTYLTSRGELPSSEATR